MSSTARAKRPAAIGATLLATFALVVTSASPAAAEPIGSGDASAFGGQVQLTDQDVLPPTALAETSLGSEDVTASAIEVPAEPLAVSGTLNSSAAVHPEADIPTSLGQVTQEVEGPYNAVGLSSIEELEVLVEQLPEGASLLSAGVLRAEAAAVCTGDAVTYTANSEILDLSIGGEPVPLNDPLTQAVAGLNELLAATTLNQVVNIEQNVVTPLEDGIAVDALVITVLAAAGDVPLATVTLGHAEVSGVTCAAAQCSDGIDNEDPEDELADAADPGCHTDGDATNPDSYDPADDDETDEALPGAPTPAPDAAEPTLPVTGGDATTTAGAAALLGAGALGVLALRRRLG